jgi:hypothetical protein
MHFSTARGRLSIGDWKMLKIDEELKNMEDVLRRLKIEYQIFFNGSRKKPPQDLRLRLEKISRQLSERSDMTQLQRFRYNTLLTRYNTLRSLWRRTIQKMEQGKEAKKDPPVSTPIQSAEAAVEKFRISLSNPGSEGDKVRHLYDTLLHYKKMNSEDLRLAYSQFERYIEVQTQNIRKDKGCSRVTYTIVLEGDVVRFTAAAEKS